MNGDGYADVIVGAYDFDQGQLNEGAAFVYLGNSAGRPVLARQRRGGVPVAPYGASGAPDALLLEIRATHPEGRGKVKAEFEVCPAGVEFSEASCSSFTTPSWTDTTASASGVTLTAEIGGLAEDTLYRWRGRVLHAPLSIDQPGVTAPALPEHGPWRRHLAQSAEADIRTIDLPEPGALASLVVGAAALVALRRSATRRC